MLISFLFWNLMKCPLQDHLATIVSSHNVDIVMLAECAVAPDDIESALDKGAIQDFQFFPGENRSEKFVLFSRAGKATLISQFDDYSGSLTVRRLQLPGVLEILIAVVHLPSAINYSEVDQLLASAKLAGDIEQTERDTGIPRTILVGDLNMNPFHPGVASAGALHAVMTKQLAARMERTVKGVSYRFFYNPMWGHFGDRTVGPAGTYHLSAAKPLNYFWNMYDQVLLRPELMYSLQDLQILDSAGIESLVTQNGKPKSSAYSDHLPIFFQLEL